MAKLDFLEKRIKSLNDSLSNNDKKILSYIFSNPEKFIRLNITEIAQEIGISVSAITRFAKKLGYEKLTNFKLAISREIGAKAERQFHDVDRDDDISVIVSKVVTCNIEAIKDVGQTLQIESLEKALQLLQNAKKMVFTGIGGSASVALDAHHKFRRLGIVTEYVMDTNSQMIVSTVGGEGDVIVVVSNEGANRELNMALRVAQKNGQKILAITRFGKSPLTNLADVSLMAMEHEFGEKPESLISRISTYCIIDILYVAYCMRADIVLEEKLASFTNSMRLLKDYND